MWNATRYDDPDLLSNVIVVRPILLLYIQRSSYYAYFSAHKQTVCFSFRDRLYIKIYSSHKKVWPFLKRKFLLNDSCAISLKGANNDFKFNGILVSFHVKYV